MLGRLERIVDYNDKVHCLKLLRSIFEHPFWFCSFVMLAAAIFYFGIIMYVHRPFATGDLLMIVICFGIPALILLPVFVFLLACCEIIAEYLAGLLFPRS